VRRGGFGDWSTVGVGVMLGGFTGVMRRMQSMAMGDVRMVGGFFVVPLLVVMGSFAVVCGCMFVVFGGFSMVIGSFVLHRIFLFRGESAGGPAWPGPRGDP